jgi:hypothetical protein
VATRARSRIGLALFAAAGFPLAAAAGSPTVPASLFLEPIGSYRERVPQGPENACRRSIAEIAAYDPLTRRVFVTNAADRSLDILDIGDPTRLRLVRRVELGAYGLPTSVTAKWGLVAVAVEGTAPNETELGSVVLLDSAGRILRSLGVGPGPDMVTFTRDGRRLLVANEGEPSQDYARDPRGSISVIDLRGGPAGAKAATAGFEAFDADALRARGVRVFGPGADGGKDLEPEFIAVSPDSETAWVTLQENNALAVLDVEAAKITDVFGLGTKDHHAAGSGLDASDEDGAIDIAAWPVAGLYQPDAIAAYWSFGRTYLVTANEGDPRGYGAFEEAKRVADLTLDPSLLAGNPDLQENDRLGRLQVSPVDADTDGDGDVDRLQAFGGRSFSIWREDGALIFDSGDVLERLTAAPELYAPAANLFNTPDDENVFNERSDARGPEPEGVTVGMLGLRTIAFLALERASGILVVDITRPDAPVRQQYIDTRDHSEDPQDVGGADADLFVNCDAGDLGPEGVLFIPAQLSPIWRPLLVVAFETSGSTTVFRIAAGRR